MGELADVNVAAAEFFRARLPGSWVPRYLEGRGIGPDLCRQWRAGYAPSDRGALTRHLRALGYPSTLVVESGLARQSGDGRLSDTFRDRVMLPIHTVDGTVAGFIGRAAPGTDVPKYVNSPTTSLYVKGEVLFGVWENHRALAAGACPVMVEGPFDAIAVTSAGQGRYAGVAPCGTSLTADQVAALSHVADLQTHGVVVAFDADPAGRRAAVRAYHLLTPCTSNVSMVVLPAGQDPAQVLSERGPAALASLISTRTRPLADLVVDSEMGKWERWLRHPEGQMNALHAAARHIAVMPPAHVGRQVARLAARLGLDHATATEAVTDALSQGLAGRSSLLPGMPTLTSPGTYGNDFPATVQRAIQGADQRPTPANRLGRRGGRGPRSYRQI